jgi:hypothetical protein
MPNPPQLSPDQRAAALKKAGEVRAARAELKEKLKMGSVTLAEVLDKASSDDVIAKMKVQALLESLPGLGKVKAKRMMEELQIADTRRVGGLGAQQRQGLLSRVG